MNARAFFRLQGPLGWLAFPSLLVAVVLTASSLLERGIPLPLVSTSVLLGTIGVLFVLERLSPLHPEWSRRPERLDLVLLIVNRGVDIGVLALTIGLLAALQARGVNLAFLRVWPAEAPLVVQAGLGVVIAEGIRYVMHRLSHTPGLLWRVHRTHHQPTRMYALNGPRLHPGNYLWIAIANSVPMLLLGAPLPAVVLAAVMTSFFVLFQHANLRLPLAGWNLVFATPDVHRLHHARRHAHDGVNYGIVLLIFDQLFGTYQPATGEVAADGIGLAGAVPHQQPTGPVLTFHGEPRR